MHSGPGSAPMLVAAAALDKLADDLYSIAASYSSVLWTLGWLTSTAAQAEHITAQARTAASTSDTAFAATVTPPEIASSRARMASLIAGNVVSQDIPAITALEAEYGDMWAQDAAAMYRLSPMSPVTAFAAAIGSPVSMTSSETSTAIVSQKTPGHHVKALAGWGHGQLVVSLVVPGSWGPAAFGSLGSIA